MTELVLENLPKVSLNKFYAGVHWATRKKLKDNYTLIIASQTKKKFTKPCEVEYEFHFKRNPLDCSNCAGGMVKMIEDCLFPNDSIKVVKSIKITSQKSGNEYVKIKVREL